MKRLKKQLPGKANFGIFLQRKCSNLLLKLCEMPLEQDFASINKTFCVGGRLGTRLSFYEA